MTKRTSLALYNLLLPFGLVLMAPGALLKMRRRGGRWRDFGGRLGFPDRERIASIERLPRDGPRFWFHAVSVGEVNVAVKIIRRLLQSQPGCGIVLTSTTPTGRELAREFASKQPARIAAVYSPVDLPCTARRVLDEFRPGHLVLVEAEVWPNVVHQAKARGIPVSLVNARLSERSERRFLAIRPWVKPVFEMLDQALVQDEADIDRLCGIGVPRERVHLSGSVKFDPAGAVVSESRLAALRELLKKTGWSEGDLVIVTASTHPGEEIEIAKIHQRLRASVPGLRLLLVPRHVERTAEIREQLRGIGIEPALRSELESQPLAADTVLVNTTGELPAWQHLASLVVVGKSFLAEGGQNPAEALMAGVPVVFGPHMENFVELTQLLLSRNGAVQVSNLAELEQAAARLLADSSRRQAIARAGRDALTAHEGATARTVGRLLALRAGRG